MWYPGTKFKSTIAVYSSIDIVMAHASAEWIMAHRSCQWIDASTYYYCLLEKIHEAEINNKYEPLK
jgi:hypothetical protein